MQKTSSDLFGVYEEENLSLLKIVQESIKDFFYWWYVKTPVIMIMRFRRLLTVIDDKFSISFLLRTFFIPWRRDYTFVGFLIGIFARIFILIPGIVVFILTTTIYLAYIIVWIAIPFVCVSLTIISPFI